MHLGRTRSAGHRSVSNDDVRKDAIGTVRSNAGARSHQERSVPNPLRLEYAESSTANSPKDRRVRGERTRPTDPGSHHCYLVSHLNEHRCSDLSDGAALATESCGLTIDQDVGDVLALQISRYVVGLACGQNGEQDQARPCIHARRA